MHQYEKIDMIKTLTRSYVKEELKTVLDDDMQDAEERAYYEIENSVQDAIDEL